VLIVKLLILLRNISRLHWNCELYSYEITIVGNIWRKPVLTYAGSVCGTAGVGEYGEYGEYCSVIFLYL